MCACAQYLKLLKVQLRNVVQWSNGPRAAFLLLWQNITEQSVWFSINGHQRSMFIHLVLLWRNSSMHCVEVQSTSHLHCCWYWKRKWTFGAHETRSTVTSLAVYKMDASMDIVILHFTWKTPDCVGGTHCATFFHWWFTLITINESNVNTVILTLPDVTLIKTTDADVCCSGNADNVTHLVDSHTVWLFSFFCKYFPWKYKPRVFCCSRDANSHSRASSADRRVADRKSYACLVSRSSWHYVRLLIMLLTPKMLSVILPFLHITDLWR